MSNSVLPKKKPLSFYRKKALKACTDLDAVCQAFGDYTYILERGAFYSIIDNKLKLQRNDIGIIAATYIIRKLGLIPHQLPIGKSIIYGNQFLVTLHELSDKLAVAKTLVYVAERDIEKHIESNKKD